mgnify:CR=1 FL=1
MSYHMNSKGEAAPCTAEPGNCPLGGDHYDNKEDAQVGIEKSMSDQLTPDLSKKRKDNVEVYRHPQGKVATIRNGVLTVTKDGKQVNSSATMEKLRAGHGRWTEDHNASVAPDSAPTLPKDALPESSPEERVRAKAALQAGYPLTTTLNASERPATPDRDPVDEHIRPRAVLPTNTRFNPHEKAGADNEYVETWNRSGDQLTFAVVKQHTDRGRPTYRMINSGWQGESDDKVGDKFTFSHDQTMRPIGNGQWEVVGVFEAKENGRAEGEIPDRNVPMYVYK